MHINLADLKKGRNARALCCAKLFVPRPNTLKPPTISHVQHLGLNRFVTGSGLAWWYFLPSMLRSPVAET
ncbi:MAG: hypothetical protein ACXW6R_20315, partial [Candidatus Binatia bacterium]